MKKKPSKEDIIKIIAKILKMSSQKVEKIDNYTRMESWDSLAQLDIISALDTKLNGKIGKIKNIAEIKNFFLGLELLHLPLLHFLYLGICQGICPTTLKLKKYGKL